MVGVPKSLSTSKSSSNHQRRRRASSGAFLPLFIFVSVPLLLLLLLIIRTRATNALTITNNNAPPSTSTQSAAVVRPPQQQQPQSSRRSWIVNSCFRSCLPLMAAVLVNIPERASAAAAAAAAAVEGDPSLDPELEELYNTDGITPAAPEERSGLVVLRVAEVAQFQEKILRAVVNGDFADSDVRISPMQFAFGTQILLRNSNIDGNIRLMIREEIPKSKRKLARTNAVTIMNTLQQIQQYAGALQRDFVPIEMIELADMYLVVRTNLNELYNYLPDPEKKKYYGFFTAVTEYEKKIADGTYNPDIDGILNFD